LAAWLVARDVAGAVETWAAFRAACERGFAVLQRHPFWFFLAMVVLLGLPVPASVLFISAGVVWPNPSLGVLWSIAAAAASMTWSHQFSARIGRRFTAAWLPRLHRRLPQLDPARAVQCILVARLTPGIPFFLQNHVLGLLGIRFRVFLPLSIVCASPYIAGFVITGGALFKGAWTHLALGLTLIAALVATRIWFTKHRKPQG
jgi:uncharacterized membrane protein YdjX (TVP38/TMEM64 family)